MKSLLVGLGIVFGIVALVFMYYTGAYNGLVTRQEGVNQSWAQVQTAYQKRNDLVPQLVGTVKGAANFEKSTLTDVVAARAKATSIQVTPETINDPQAFKKFEAAQGQMTGALSRLLVTIEKYPELKATGNFSELQSQLEGIENRIAVSRRDFNLAVQVYNVGLRRFPTSIVANLSGFKEKSYFEAAAGSDKAPEVKF
jgi:LemA protein